MISFLILSGSDGRGGGGDSWVTKANIIEE